MVGLLSCQKRTVGRSCRPANLRIFLVSIIKSQVILLQTAHSWANAGVLLGARSVIFIGARIRLGTILGRFSINYFSGLGMRIRVRVWVTVRVRVTVSVVIWSG